jgi:hypothetical protein
MKASADFGRPWKRPSGVYRDIRPNEGVAVKGVLGGIHKDEAVFTINVGAGQAAALSSSRPTKQSYQSHLAGGALVLKEIRQLEAKPKEIGRPANPLSSTLFLPWGGPNNWLRGPFF